jgi:hypothetical protein
MCCRRHPLLFQERKLFLRYRFSCGCEAEISESSFSGLYHRKHDYGGCTPSYDTGRSHRPPNKSYSLSLPHSQAGLPAMARPTRF